IEFNPHKIIIGPVKIEQKLIKSIMVLFIVSSLLLMDSGVSIARTNRALVAFITDKQS
ncbi:MAG: hypothetical protein JWR67_3852, partial [Mucilaginibacter sp.]|nr:hypothetical protein [Mucilaginibacter sp.]